MPMAHGSGFFTLEAQPEGVHEFKASMGYRVSKTESQTHKRYVYKE